jgi:hypothetical protein
LAVQKRFDPRAGSAPQQLAIYLLSGAWFD